MDTTLNRTLRAAFKKIQKIRRHNAELNTIRGLFNGIADLNINNNDIIDFSSKNYYCKNAYLLAKLILEESYFDSSGNIGGEYFIINSDLLFEEFIKKYCLEYLMTLSL